MFRIYVMSCQIQSLGGVGIKVARHFLPQEDHSSQSFQKIGGSYSRSQTTLKKNGSQ